MVPTATRALPDRALPDRPDALIVSGGGAKAISALGAVHALRRAGRLDGVRVAAGTSAGAIVAASVALKREPTELLRSLLTHSFSPDIDLGKLAMNFGVDTGAHIAKWIDIVLGGPHTFRGVLEATGVELVVCATNLSKREAVYFGPSTHPDMDVATALRMTCAIPLCFAAVRFEGDVYVDGGIVDNFCYDRIARRPDVRSPLGIAYRSKDQCTPVTSLDQYFLALVQCATVQQRVVEGANVLEIDCGDAGVMSFKKRADMQLLFRSGVEQAREWVKKRA